MNIIADLHTHTLVSNHAFSTLHEMITQAATLGHFAMALTDHGQGMPDAPHPWYFQSLRVLPRKINGVWLMRGVECSVRDKAGTLDFTAKEFERLRFDWVIASIHGDMLEGVQNYDSLTRLWLNVAENPYVDLIGHSESPKYEYNYDLVTRAFTQHDKVVEMNANSAIVRPGGEGNLRRLALACKENRTLIAVNSDAHSLYTLGYVEPVLQMLEEIEFPQERIVNASKENLIAYCKRRKKIIAQDMETQEET